MYTVWLFSTKVKEEEMRGTGRKENNDFEKRTEKNLAIIPSCIRKKLD